MRRPRFIAEKSRHARGFLGRLIAFIMARETWRDNLGAIAALDIQPGNRVLDVGTGHGRSLAELARQVGKGYVTGADPSALMIKKAGHRNHKLVRSGRVDLIQADASHLPFDHARFDRVLCVHVVYFWEDRDAALREIARVMKPGAKLALVFRTAANSAAVSAFPADVYRFPDFGEVCSELAAAGFSVDAGDTSSAETKAEPVMVVATKSPV
jgi:ubiquinone/menaquinone biosynthesis C-methylase UbiE